MYCLFVFSEKPFYLKEVYLPTNCTDCLVVYEKVKSGQDTFTSLLLFSRARTFCSWDRSQMLILTFDFCDCRQETERLICRSGGSQKKSSVSRDAFAYNHRLKLRSEKRGPGTCFPIMPCTFLLMCPSCVRTQISAQRTSPLPRASAPSTPYLKRRWASVSLDFWTHSLM